MPSGLAQLYELKADRMAPRAAREHVRRSCAGRTSQSQADSVTLVVSEIVTNAVRHGRGNIRVVLRVSGSEVFVAVVDQGPSFVASPLVVEPLHEGGRGLSIVAQIASNWGVLGLGHAGKLVWCVVAQVRSARPEWAGPGAAFLLGSSEQMDVPPSTESISLVSSKATA